MREQTMAASLELVLVIIIQGDCLPGKVSTGNEIKRMMVEQEMMSLAKEEHFSLSFCSLCFNIYFD